MSEWISVEDETPEDDKLKVCRYARADFGRLQHMGICLSRYYSPDNLPNNQRRWCFEFASTQPGKITHWMPIPEPPK